MSAETYAYRPRAIVTSIMKVTLNGGFGEDEFLTIEYLSDSAVSMAGVFGDVVIGAIDDLRADIKLTFLAASPENLKMQALYDAGRKSDAGVKVGEFDVRDVLGNDKHKAKHVFFKKPPPVTYKRGPAERVWSLEATDLESYNAGRFAL